jgi:hypothetical protein
MRGFSERDVGLKGVSRKIVEFLNGGAVAMWQVPNRPAQIGQFRYAQHGCLKFDFDDDVGRVTIFGENIKIHLIKYLLMRINELRTL